MKKLYSFLWLVLFLAVILITSLINHVANPDNFWYINLPLVLVFLCVSIFTIYIFSQETENIKKQNVLLVILFPLIFALPQYPILEHMSFALNNRVLTSNYFLGLGSVFSIAAFSLSAKNTLGNIFGFAPKFFKFIGIFTYIMSIFASIQNCFQQSINVVM